jgi:hypothetical protein
VGVAVASFRRCFNQAWLSIRDSSIGIGSIFNLESPPFRWDKWANFPRKTLVKTEIFLGEKFIKAGFMKSNEVVANNKEIFPTYSTAKSMNPATVSYLRHADKELLNVWPYLRR